jgi:hypothetical protein
MLLHIPVVEIRAFLVLPQIQKGQKKAAEMECAGGGAGVVVFEADFPLKFVRLVFFHNQP